jgi:hypothetical protein
MLPIESRIRIFEDKIEEYFLSCHPSIASRSDTSFLSEWPLYKFSIVRLHAAMSERFNDESLRSSIAEKLIDIKLHFAYLLTINVHFYRGATLIVGNNEIDKLNPRTISVLRATHYRVYLLSVLIEQILDLLSLLMDGKLSSHKKGKWNKIIERVHESTGNVVLTHDDASLLLAFKEQYRTAEIHHFSQIRALTGKSQWTHLHDEEQAVMRLIKRLFAYYVLV